MSRPNIAGNHGIHTERGGRLDLKWTTLLSPPSDAGRSPAGRFQISAFTNGTGGTGFGNYVIDPTTGEFWMGYGDEKPSKVSEPLLK